ncbi:MAG: SDR family oxidoreductase [Gemmatimonadales bacterium]|nr:SDR family oxidoreductase [Gemmatimonadales bacterium]
MVSHPAVLVTGASTGIGEACALELDRLGYTVYAGVRKSVDGDRLRGQASPRLEPIPLDVTDAGEIESAFSRIESQLGGAGLAGLINNAGIAGGGPLEVVPLDEVRRVFEVNVIGLLAVTQAAIPLLRRARGRVVNIGSIAGKAVTPFVGPYCMSKFAVEALTDGLRLELAPDRIDVVVIEPGAVRTPIWQKGLAALSAAPPMPPSAEARYGDKLRFLGKLLELNARRGVPPEAVVDAVVDAMRAERPRTRYLVGKDAKMRAALTRFMPDRVTDFVIRSVLARLERKLA